ncbi:zinc ribbon domain-containing protein [Desulfuromonas sp. TF]|uniref:FmdB family zinc ribbon protein n=1 Tax=Desulfuromonas sp. TF TaxID=1232410 RepID=UPI0035102A99
MAMPTYEYRCERCREDFTVQMGISEHDRGEIKCPKCGGAEVVQQYSTFYAKTSRKS